MVQIEYIKKLYFKEGKSIREISRILGHSRNTISKYLFEDVITEPQYKLAAQKNSPVLDPVKPIINQWLLEDEQMPKKQRHSGVRIYHRLVEEYGFTGGSSTVRNYVYEQRSKPPKTFIPLEYEFGDNAQVDWGQAIGIIGGKKVTIHLYCMTLSASGASFLMAFPHEKQEAFLKGHKEAFKFFGGVPQSVTYDNLKSAVKKVLQGHNRIEQNSFIALRTHYLFDSIFCNPAKGNEKGLVEGFVGYARRNFLVPLPEFPSFELLNEFLKAKCLQYIDQGKRKGNKKIRELFEIEQSKLRPLPLKDFPCCRYIDAKVNSYSQIQFEGNRYSVSNKFAYQTVQVQVFVNYIDIYKDGNKIATHLRSYEKGKEISNIDHYLDVLVSKPRAVQNATPLKTEELSFSYQELRRKIAERHKTGNHEFIKILRLHRSYPTKSVDDAVELALTYQVFHFEGVRNLLLQLITPETKHQPLKLETQSDLGQVTVKKPELKQFNQLLEGGC